MNPTQFGAPPTYLELASQQVQFQFADHAREYIYTYQGVPLLLYNLRDLLSENKAACAISTVNAVGTRRIIRVEPCADGSIVGQQVEEWLDDVNESGVGQRYIFESVERCVRYFDHQPQFAGTVWHDYHQRQMILPSQIQVIRVEDLASFLMGPPEAEL